MTDVRAIIILQPFCYYSGVNMSHKKLYSTSTWLSLFILLVVVMSVLNPSSAFAAANIAQGKTASADSAQTANPAASGNDGSTTTRWCAADGNLNHWWKV